MNISKKFWLFGFLTFMVFLAVILALWEIQIEGKDGWAANLPCWRLEKGWVVRLTGGTPITGYHVYMIVFMLAIIHLPLFFVNWSSLVSSAVPAEAS